MSKGVGLGLRIRVRVRIRVRDRVWGETWSLVPPDRGLGWLQETELQLLPDRVGGLC